MALFGLVVFSLEGSAVQLGTVLASMFVPYFLLGPFAGVLVDRWPRRLTMVVSDLGRAAVYAWLSRAGSLPDILPAVFAASALRIFFQPALSSLVPSVVSASNLQAANSALRAARGVCRIAGPAAGGALVAALGPGAVFLMNAATFVVSAATVLFITREEALQPAGPLGLRQVAADMVEGFRTILDTPQLRFLIGFHLWLMVGFGAHDVLLWPFLREVAGFTQMQVAWAETATAAGSVLGAAGIGLWGRGTPFRLLMFPSLAGMGASLLMMVANPAFAPICAFSLLLGLSYPGFDITFTTVLQAGTPNTHRGRVFGTAEAAIEGTAIVTRSALAAATALAGLVPVLGAASASLLALAAYGGAKSRGIPALGSSGASLVG